MTNNPENTPRSQPRTVEEVLASLGIEPLTFDEKFQALVRKEQERSDQYYPGVGDCE